MNLAYWAAAFSIGMDWTMTLPGPVSSATKSPSPPQHIAAAVPARRAPMSTVASHATRASVSRTMRSPSRRRASSTVPPPLRKAVPEPPMVAKIGPCPAQQPPVRFLAKRTPKSTPRPILAVHAPRFITIPPVDVW